MADKTITVSLDFVANTNQAEASLQKLSSALVNISNKSTIGQDARMAQNIEEASVAAMKLRQNLQSAFDHKTGQLNLSKLNEEMAKSGMSAEKYRRTLSAIGPEGRQAFMELANAVVASKTPLKQTSGLVDKLWDSLKRTAGWQLSSTVIHGFMGAIQSAYGYAQDLNQSLNNIRIVTGYSSEEMAKFADKANKAAKALSSTTTDYTDAALIYYQQGIRDENEIAGRTDTTIKLANVSRQSAEEVSSQMTAIWNNFDDGSHSLEYYADVITKLGATTAASSSEIAGGMEKFAAVADTVGLSYEYAASSLATIVATTRQSEDTVGTGLRTIFSRLEGLKLGETLEDGTDLNKYSKALATIGVDIKDASGELKNMDTILDETASKWDGLDRAQKVAFATTVGGVRQYTNLVALLDNWDMMQENVATARGSEGTLQEQQDIYAESWEAASKRVRAAAESIYDDLLNDDFFIELNNLFAGILETVDKLIDAFGGLGGTLPLILTLVNKIFGDKIQKGAQQLAENIYYSTKSGKAAREKEDFETQTAFIKETKAMQQESVGKNEGNIASIGYEKIAALQSEMIAKDKELTDAERGLYKMAIDRAQVLTKSTAELGKYADEAREIANEQKFDLMTGTDKTNDKGQLRFQQDYQKLNLQGDWNVLSQNGSAIARELEDILGLTENSIQLTGQLKARYQEFANLGLKGTLSADLDQIITKTEKIANQSGISDQIGTIYKSFNNLDLTTAKAELERLATAAGDAGKKILDSFNAGQYTKIEEIQEAFIKLRAAVKTSVTTSSNDLTQFGDTLARVYGFTSQEIQEFIEVCQNAANAEQKGAQASDAMAKGLERLMNSAHGAEASINGTSQRISNMLNSLTKFGQAAMNVSMIINSIKGISNTLNSADMSPWEKFSSILMSMGMLIPAIVSALNGLATVKSILMGVTLVSTGLTITETVAQAALNKKIDENTQAEIINAIAKKGVKNKTVEEVEALILSTIQRKAETVEIDKNTKALARNAAMRAKNSTGKNGDTVKNALNEGLFGGGRKAGQNIATGLFSNLKATFLKLFNGAKTLIGNLGKFLFHSIGGWVTLAVAAVIATYAIVKAISEKELKDAQAKYDAAKKNQELAQKDYETQSQNYDKLKSTTEEYQKLRNSLNSITKGTTEWYEATAKINELVSDLLLIYPQLGDKIEVIDGKMIIADKDLAEAQQRQAQILLAAQQSKNIAMVSALQASKELKEVELGYELGGKTLGISKGIDRMQEASRTYGATDETSNKIRHDLTGKADVEGSMEDLINLVRTRGSQVLDDKKILGSELHFDSKDIDAIQDNETAIIEAAKQVGQADASIQALTEVNKQLLAERYGNENDEYGNASTEVQGIIADALDVDPTKYRDEYSKWTKSGVTDEAIKYMNEQEQIKDTGISYEATDTNGKVTIMQVDAQGKKTAYGEKNSYTKNDLIEMAATSRAFVESNQNMQTSRNDYVGVTNDYLEGLTSTGVLKPEDATSIVTGIIQDAFLKGINPEDINADNISPELLTVLGNYTKKELDQVIDQLAQDSPIRKALEDYTAQGGQYEQDHAVYADLQKSRVESANAEFLGAKNDAPGTDWIEAASKGSEQAIQVVQSLQEMYGLTEEKAKEYLATMAEIMGIQDPFGADKIQKKLLDEASSFTSLTDEAQGLEKAIKKCGQSSDEATKAQHKLDKALKTIKWTKFAKDAGKYIDTINEGVDPDEMEKAYEGLAKGINSLFDTSVSKEWVNENMAAINKLQKAAISGNEKATQQAAMELEFLANLASNDLEISADGSQVLETITGISNAYDAVAAYIQSGKITMTADGHADFSQMINEMIAAGAEGETVAAILAAIGQTEVDFSGSVPQGIDAPPGKIDLTDPASQASLVKWINSMKGMKVNLDVTGGAIPDFSPAAMKNLGGSGAKGGGGGGGGGGGEKKKKETPKEDRSTRYHSVTQRSTDITRKQEENNRRKDRAFGKAQVDLAKKDLELQQKKIILQEEYTKEISKNLKDDREEMKKQFEDLKLPINFKFDEDGEIANYQEIMDALFEKEKALVEQYNSGGLDDEAFDEAKKKLDEAKEALGNYEETLELQKDELQTLAEYMEELSDKALELTQIKFELNMSIVDDQLEWLDYSLSKIEDDAYSAAKAIALMGEQTDQYIEKGKVIRASIMEILGRHGIDSINKLNGLTDEQIEALGFNKDEIEALKDYRSQLYDVNNALLEMRQTIVDKVMDTFDEFNEKVQKSYEQFDYYNDVLEKFADITDLLGNKTDEKTRELIKSIRDTQLKNLQNQSISAKEIYEGALVHYDLAEKAYNDAVAKYGANSLEAQKMKEILDQAADARDEAYENWLDAYQASLEKAREIYEAEMEELQRDFEQALTGIYGTFDLFDAAYERAKELKDNYLPEYEKIYELNKLNRDIQKEIDNSTSLRDRKALRQLQEEINRKQEAGVQLSKYEVEEMRKKFELEQARMALEDARNNKSEVRLTRDANGNWGYVYTASEDKVAEAEQKYEDALYNYQKLSDDYINDLDEKIKDLTKNTQARIKEVQDALAANLINEDQAREQIQDIMSNFYTQQDYLISQFQTSTENLSGSLGLMFELYGQEAELVDTFNETTYGKISGFNSIEEWKNNNINAVNEYADGAIEAAEKLKATNEELAKQNELNLDTIAKATENIGTLSDQAKEKTTELVQEFTTNFDSVMKALDEWETKYGQIIDAALGKNEDFITSLSTMIRGLASVASFEMKDFYEYVDYLSQKGAKGETITKEEWDKLDEIKSKYFDNASKEVAGFSEGGYTGDWGDEGKIAVLHEKEYVLNADLTARFFDALKTFSLVDQFLNIEKQQEQQLAQIQMLTSLNHYIDQLADRMNTTLINSNDFSGGLVKDNNQQLEQNVHIEASFPNVTQSSEIEMAFDNLVNKASQYANRKNMQSMTFGDSYINTF